VNEYAEHQTDERPVYFRLTEQLSHDEAERLVFRRVKLNTTKRVETRTNQTRRKLDNLVHRKIGKTNTFAPRTKKPVTSLIYRRRKEAIGKRHRVQPACESET
jgi:hypothetical protein